MFVSPAKDIFEVKSFEIHSYKYRNAIFFNYFPPLQIMPPGPVSPEEEGTGMQLCVHLGLAGWCQKLEFDICHS